MNILGDRIKKLRKENHLNQTQLANALNQQFGLNIDRVMISKWETGFQTPVMHSVICLAKFFNVSIDYLNDNEISSPPLEGELTPEQKELIDLYVSAPSEIQSAALTLLRAAEAAHISPDDGEANK